LTALRRAFPTKVDRRCLGNHHLKNTKALNLRTRGFSRNAGFPGSACDLPDLLVRKPGVGLSRKFYGCLSFLPLASQKSTKIAQ